ncbi:lipopolysaccharide transport periplasmic protein LptA [Mariprofundus ferrinatatus]|uniref:lipopolysaccharide transport periplasmic protein LptA n=1 Tax=Mariprofundus ferrinatatus TaxID=1921087 RepID=UPI001E2E14FF|nr:lipopolysaccharide transport periplasmic protein LptA [Mariprofundus ferrinatatus]
MVRFAIIVAIFMMPSLLWAGAMEIESDRMVFQHKSERAEFISNVHLKRDDFELWCDKLLAYYKNSQLDHTEAFGHVRLAQKGITGSSDKAIFDQKNNRLTLIGNAVLEQDGSRITGETIIHDMRNEKTVVQPRKGGRTHMTIESDKAAGTPLPKAAK